MKTKVPSFAALALASAYSVQAQNSPWLPDPGQIVVSPSYTFQTFDTFWQGDKKVELPDNVEQHTASLTLEYGIYKSLAADATVGWTWVDTTKAFGAAANDDGLNDTTFGLRWRFLDETATSCKYAPTLALRVGGIIEGTYNEGLPFSAGDGASGAQASLLFGKQICTGFGLYGDFGYRWRNQHVPEDLFGSFGVYTSYKGFTVNVAYRHVQGLSGPDIGDPGYTFPRVREIQQNIEAGLGYTDKGGRYYQVFYAHTLDGRNTGEKDIFGVSISLPFGGSK